MKTATKIKGILAMAGISYKDLSQLCGLSRQTIHTYLNDPNCFMEDYEGGVKVLAVTNRLMALTTEGKLPLPKTADKVSQIKVLLVT